MPTIADAPPSSPAPPKPAAAPAKPAPRRLTQVDLSFYTSETSDQNYFRLARSMTEDTKKWFINGAYRKTASRSFYATKVSTSYLRNYLFDSQLRNDYTKNKGYRFVSATLNLTTREPVPRNQLAESGYYLINAGAGSKLLKGLDQELALSVIKRYEEDQRITISPTYSLRVDRSINNSLKLDGLAYIIGPFSSETLLDARAGIVYTITPSWALRLTYLANNFKNTNTQRVGWESSIRLGLNYSMRD